MVLEIKGNTVRLSKGEDDLLIKTNEDTRILSRSNLKEPVLPEEFPSSPASKPAVLSDMKAGDKISARQRESTRRRARYL